MEEDYYFDEYGVKRRKKELRELDIDEISLCSAPATKKEYVIVKGDDEMDGEMVELKTWEDVSQSEILKIRETIKILNKYDLTEDLKRAKEHLERYFGGREVGAEVKKYNERCEWTTVQNQLYGYCEDDLDFVNENIEVEKGSPDNKWPSLSGQFELNRRRLESRAV